LTEKFLSRKPDDQPHKTVRDLARGNAFIIANVDKGTEINIEVGKAYYHFNFVFIHNAYKMTSVIEI
jgi:hypothetical protein